MYIQSKYLFQIIAHFDRFHTGYPGPTVLTPPLDFEVIGSIFFRSKAEVFLHKISFAEKIIKSGGPRRGRQSGVAKFFFRRHLQFFLIIADLEVVETKLFFKRNLRSKAHLQLLNFLIHTVASFY